jgi:hypothetical protein
MAAQRFTTPTANPRQFNPGPWWLAPDEMGGWLLAYICRPDDRASAAENEELDLLCQVNAMQKQKYSQLVDKPITHKL